MDAYPDTLVQTFCPLRRSTGGEILFQQATWLTLAVTVLIVAVSYWFCWRRSRGKVNEVPAQRCGEENVRQVPSGRMRKSDIVRYYGRRMIKKDYRLIIVSCVGMFLPLASSQVYPARFSISDSAVAFVNGSSQYCTDNFITRTSYRCPNPRTSVLFGTIPTLTGLDGDQWANQLFTVKGPSTAITFDFTDVSDYTGVEKIEVVMFHCPQWRIGLDTISILESSTFFGSRHSIGNITSTATTSCDSLVRLCTNETNSSQLFITLSFTDFNWVHLAEVTFYSDVGSSCPTDAILTPLLPTAPLTPMTTTSIVTTSSTTMTTDVQGVSVCLVEGSIYSIQCSYIAGSNSVSGCSYVLVSVVQDTRDIHGTIDESRTVNKEVPNLGDYGRILVYDEVKVVVMNETLDLEKNGSCTITEATITITTITAISTGLLCGALGVIVASIVAVCLHLHAKKTVRDNPIALVKHLNNCEHQEMQKEELQGKVKWDPNPSYERVSIDRNPSYEVVSVDPDPL